MRFAAYRQNDTEGLAVWADGAWYGAADVPPLAPLLAQGPSALADVHGRLRDRGRRLDAATLAFLPPLGNPAKIICVGLNYADHSAESGFAIPSYPAIFTRVASSLIGHGAPILRPRVSDQLDYEGELVAVIGRGGRYIPKASALDHVAGYSIFNDASVRDYQMKSTQWTIGKNFDGTGSFGPSFVTSDELPPGAKGLRLQTRLSGAVVQDASTDDMIFDVATLIAILSEAVTLAPGDVIVTGTPAGVGLARKPQLWMKPGDTCEVEIEGIGILSNPIENETVPAS